jgi:hypothetical protein
MTRVTTPGLEIRDRWPALTSVMWAPARWAMDCSKAGGMTLSAVPITAHDGMVFQAGVPEGSPSVLAASGRWVAAMIAAWRGGQAAGEAAGDQGRLDVGVDVAGRAAGVGHEVEHVGGVAAQARSGHRAEEPAEGLALVGDERVHEHQGLDLWVADGGVGDDRPAVGVPDQHDRVPGQGRVLGEEVVQVGGVLREAAQRVGRRVHGEAGICRRRMTRSQLEPSAQAPCSSTITGFGPPPQPKAREPPARAEAPWLVRASTPATARTAAKMIRSSRVRCAAQEILIDVPSFARSEA